MSGFAIAGRAIGPEHPPYIVAELSGNHNGELGRAFQLMDAAKATGADAIKLSVNDFILKASAEALRRVPAVNASWAGTSIRTHSAVHLSFGVALEDGLVTPVIRDAHAKTLKDIAIEAKALIGKARSKLYSLSAAECCTTGRKANSKQ